MKKVFKDILTEDDCKVFLSAFLDAALKHGRGEGVYSFDRFPKEFIEDLEKRYGRSLPAFNALRETLIELGYQESFDYTSRIASDRFFALRCIKGGAFTDSFIATAKSFYLKRLFPYYSPDDRKISAAPTRPYAMKALNEMLKNVCSSEVDAILLLSKDGSNTDRLAYTLERFYFTDDEKAKLKEYLLIQDKRLPSDSIHLNASGHIVARPIAPSKIIPNIAGGFAAGIAAAETGLSAQAKNPMSRSGNSGDKKMNRDGGPD